MGLLPAKRPAAWSPTTLDGAPRLRRREWTRQVMGQLLDRLGDLGAYDFEIHAEAPYRDFGLIDAV